MVEASRRFRPLAGIMVLIGKVGNLPTDETSRFRPLAGIMVLIDIRTTVRT